MEPTRRTFLGTAAVAVGIAGCLTDDEGEESQAEATDGDGAETDTDVAASETPEPDDGDGDEADEPTVRVRTHDEYGDVLVGPEGMTLYAFDRDPKGDAESACHGDCADTWPPLTVDDSADDGVEAGEGVAAELTTFEREDGDPQLAAAGWPLYYFAGDEEPGDATGQGVNDAWWVLDPEGTPVTDVRSEDTPEPTDGAAGATPDDGDDEDDGDDGNDGGGGYY